jgi:hypothetical protein
MSSDTKCDVDDIIGVYVGVTLLVLLVLTLGCCGERRSIDKANKLFCTQWGTDERVCNLVFR